MFIVKTNKAQYEYDIHSLVKAFYPEKDVRVLTPASVVKDKTILERPPAIQITFSPDSVELQFGNAKEAAGNYIWNKIQDGNADDKSADDKNAFKRFLYTSLREETGLSLPWGNLTGIRPTKIPMALLEQGKTDEEIYTHLRNEHFVSRDKALLNIEIAKREMEILRPLHYENGYSLYIGIPFCPTTCLYCSFTSFPISLWKEQVSKYLDALEKEIDFIAKLYKDKTLDTVYIGGGTPTSLSAGELDRLLSKIKASFNFATVQEFTVEAGRADSITKEKLDVLYRHGVTRISVNPQTMKQETLKFIGRQHTVEQVIDAFHMAREVGFDNINMDMILGLPGEKEEDVKASIKAIEALSPDSLTVHSLAVKRASKLSQWILENGIDGLHNTDETMKIAEEGARRMGMSPYYLYRQKNMSGNFENVGYAKEGKYGIYNILIMEEKQSIIALGAGTVTKRVYGDGRIERCDTVKDVSGYIRRIDEMIERKRKLLRD
ncbi:MAG: coproporphyrinogen dehydrogenase HemZ [Bacillus sp. (in: Bacteria)]|nr:coproporphyrinogen dehydrogenase HemZ [Bacillus sp. (in: firmicutes)]MCM1426319.1 coproporphyrinogen dehydrogenase HemZ [Eubacterium sp.]